MAAPTHVTSPEDLTQVRRCLDTEPIANAVVVHRAFDAEGSHAVHVDAIPPKAVLAVGAPRWSGGASALAFHAESPAAAKDLLDALPSGPGNIHLTEEWLLAMIEPRVAELDGHAAWLFALDKEDFVDLQMHEVQRIGPEWATMIAKAWEPEYPLEGYVRGRLEAGPAYGIFEGKDLVAWAATHLETETVSMMGFLHVAERARGRGYAKSVGSALVKDILARGKVPALHVYVDNVPSLELTPQLGFHRVKRQAWAFAVFR